MQHVFGKDYDGNLEWRSVYVVETVYSHVRFKVFTAVTMKNGVFWDVTPCGSCFSVITVNKIKICPRFITLTN
jgi:hypothetical protein